MGGERSKDMRTRIDLKNDLDNPPSFLTNYCNGQHQETNAYPATSLSRIQSQRKDHHQQKLWCTWVRKISSCLFAFPTTQGRAHVEKGEGKGARGGHSLTHWPAVAPFRLIYSQFGASDDNRHSRKMNYKLQCDPRWPHSPSTSTSCHSVNDTTW